MMALLLLVMALMVGGCAKDLITLHLSPDILAQDCTKDEDRNLWTCGTPSCTGMPKFFTGCNSSIGNLPEKSTDPSNPLVVGWFDRYDPGTEPCPCWEWVSHFQRGFVRFNLSNLQLQGNAYVESIESAALSWKTKKIEGDSSKACIKALYEATGPWKKGKTPVKLLFNDLDTKAKNGGYYGVTKQVKRWWEHPNENYGLMFWPSRAKTVDKSNSRCEDSLKDIRLTVKYRKKDVKWPGT